MTANSPVDIATITESLSGFEGDLSGHPKSRNPSRIQLFQDQSEPDLIDLRIWLREYEKEFEDPKPYISARLSRSDALRLSQAIQRFLDPTVQDKILEELQTIRQLLEDQS